ncbi:3-oxoacid CoA-transferase subunit A [Cupriavidus respiraculi]|uniref:3-oxoadipate CoA-transferase subunit A n=1 Tax=Cupriavidus respiraculi TaxID=195930 RepID=A0ABM8WJ65_9BURK|nr:3-oxoacid CoA-transferase subunit A [Cupriavidus respiraculi]MBY4948170.1 3-oxoacid CoA-transferase subunit A [Cupriavidus respiraculi]CAG9167402.1 3-oxoadipate CoA-transferase subunit A [Cupriavidus respiraculi]
MIDKTVASLEEAVACIREGDTVLVSGFGGSGIPGALLDALLARGVGDLTIVNNNAGNGDTGIAALIRAGRVRKVICSHPRSNNAEAFIDAYRAGKVALECVPQGTLVERMRAAGAGLGPFFTPTAYGTALAEGKEARMIDGVGYVLEQPLRGDVALVKAHRADRWGNLVYRYAGRNFGPVMCTAARHTVVQVDEIVPLGSLAPEHVMTPGIFVNAVVSTGARHDS